MPVARVDHDVLVLAANAKVQLPGRRGRRRALERRNAGSVNCNQSLALPRRASSLTAYSRTALLLSWLARRNTSSANALVDPISWRPRKARRRMRAERLSKARMKTGAADCAALPNA